MLEDYCVIGPNFLRSLLKVLMLKVQLAFTKYETYHFIEKAEESRMQLSALRPKRKPNKVKMVGKVEHDVLKILYDNDRYVPSSQTMEKWISDHGLRQPNRKSKNMHVLQKLK